MENVENVPAGAFTLPASGFTAPAGKQFGGWATSATGSAIPDAAYNVTANMTFYAVWEDIPHTHDYGTDWLTDAERHWHACKSCKDKKDEAAHTFAWKTDREATVTEAGEKHAECTVCGYYTITSCHAGSSKGVFEYLALKVMQSSVGKSLPYPVIFKLLHLVLDVIVCIHNDKQNGLGRHITELWYDPESKFKEY